MIWAPNGGNDVLPGLEGGVPVLSGETWENEPCNANKGWLPLPKPWPKPGTTPALISSPQAQHYFTQADQVNQLVSAREADPDLGFMGAADGVVLAASQQPRRPASVQARQRSLHALHGRPVAATSCPSATCRAC